MMHRWFPPVLEFGLLFGLAIGAGGGSTLYLYGPEASSNRPQPVVNSSPDPNPQGNPGHNR